MHQYLGETVDSLELFAIRTVGDKTKEKCWRHIKKDLGCHIRGLWLYSADQCYLPLKKIYLKNIQIPPETIWDYSRLYIPPSVETNSIDEVVSSKHLAEDREAFWKQWGGNWMIDMKARLKAVAVWMGRLTDLRTLRDGISVRTNRSSYRNQGFDLIYLLIFKSE